MLQEPNNRQSDPWDQLTRSGERGDREGDAIVRIAPNHEAFFATFGMVGEGAVRESKRVGFIHHRNTGE